MLSNEQLLRIKAIELTLATLDLYTLEKRNYGLEQQEVKTNIPEHIIALSQSYYEYLSQPE